MAQGSPKVVSQDRFPEITRHERGSFLFYWKNVFDDCENLPLFRVEANASIKINQRISTRWNFQQRDEKISEDNFPATYFTVNEKKKKKTKFR